MQKRKKVAKTKRTPTKDRRQQAMHVLRSFRVIYGSVRHHFREIEKRCGVSGSQLWILQQVHQHPGIGVSELAHRLAIHQSTCSQLVEKLVNAGQLVKSRSSEDQRRVGLSVTRKGKGTVACAPGPAEGVLPEALGELSTRSLKSLQRSLLEVIQHLELEVERAAGEPLADL
jgi:MarR family transcriptional regulator, organic hydroperoxide resistance regulator